MPRAWLGECRDATRLQDARELADHVGGVRRVMERVEADDAIDAAVRSGIDRPSTCTNSAPAGRRRRAACGTARRQYSAPSPRRRGARRGSPAVSARARSRAGAAAKIEHDVTRSQPQAVQHRRQIHQQPRRFDDGAKRLGEVIVPNCGARRSSPRPRGSAPRVDVSPTKVFTSIGRSSSRGLTRRAVPGSGRPVRRRRQSLAAGPRQTRTRSTSPRVLEHHVRRRRA